MLSSSEIEAAENPLFLITRHLITLVNSVPPADRPEFVRNLTRGQRIVWGTFLLVGEVNNGGFNQFFWNNAREEAEMAIEAFRLLGASEHLAVLRDAVARLDMAADKLAPYARQRTLESFSQSYSEAVFDDLDGEFFKLNCDPLLDAYIRSHLDEFVL